MDHDVRPPDGPRLEQHVPGEGLCLHAGLLDDVTRAGRRASPKSTPPISPWQVCSSGAACELRHVRDRVGDEKNKSILPSRSIAFDATANNVTLTIVPFPYDRLASDF
ncbi:MAG: hypothetical protein JSS42_10130 [Proteobacteria bacterium]|uniref:hypothetical protein n=1 Tax=Rudaea sp. TaxID=2136325 RepID=UPI00322056E2|nr:hypothetical protein [Pseudomonadota bacterium]